MQRARAFWKMSGSGNDFVFFDARNLLPGILETPAAIGALCAQRTGIGADGVVFLERGNEGEAFSIRYFNRDGSLAALCGNASLCSVRLARDLAIISEGERFAFGTSSGPMRGRLHRGHPEIEMVRVRDPRIDLDTPLIAGERRIGYARVGVPHVVVLVENVEAVNVDGRGAQLRSLAQLPDGANANFVSQAGGSWSMRTFERGVERETLACGTGAVASAYFLAEWGISDGTCRLRTRSGSELDVRFAGVGDSKTPTLSGEGRVVYRGELGDIPGASSPD